MNSAVCRTSRPLARQLVKHTQTKSFVGIAYQTEESLPKEQPCECMLAYTQSPRAAPGRVPHPGNLTQTRSFVGISYRHTDTLPHKPSDMLAYTQGQNSHTLASQTTNTAVGVNYLNTETLPSQRLDVMCAYTQGRQNHALSSATPLLCHKVTSHPVQQKNTFVGVTHTDEESVSVRSEPQEALLAYTQGRSLHTNQAPVNTAVGIAYMSEECLSSPRMEVLQAYTQSASSSLLESVKPLCDHNTLSASAVNSFVGINYLSEDSLPEVQTLPSDLLAYTAQEDTKESQKQQIDIHQSLLKVISQPQPNTTDIAQDFEDLSHYVYPNIAESTFVPRSRALSL